MHRLHLGLCSHPKELLENEVRTQLNSKEKNPLYRRLRGGSNPRRCVTQDSGPNTLPAELFRPPPPPPPPNKAFRLGRSCPVVGQILEKMQQTVALKPSSLDVSLQYLSHQYGIVDFLLGKSATLVFTHRLVGLVVKASARERKIPGSNPVYDGIFAGLSHTSDLKKLALQWLPCQAPGVIGSLLGLVGPVSVYCLGEMESWICNFYLSVAARKIV